jgi:hypothetical protein
VKLCEERFLYREEIPLFQVRLANDFRPFLKDLFLEQIQQFIIQEAAVDPAHLGKLSRIQMIQVILLKDQPLQRLFDLDVFRQAPLDRPCNIGYISLAGVVKQTGHLNVSRQSSRLCLRRAVQGMLRDAVEMPDIPVGPAQERQGVGDIGDLDIPGLRLQRRKSLL